MNFKVACLLDEPLSLKSHYWVFNYFYPSWPHHNYYSKFLTVHHINFCTSSYFGVVNPRCSINFQENLKVSDNGVPNSMIRLSHLTHQISSSESQNCNFYCNVGIFSIQGFLRQLLWFIKNMYKTNLKYEKIENCSAQMMLQLLIKYPFWLR